MECVVIWHSSRKWMQETVWLQVWLYPGAEKMSPGLSFSASLKSNPSTYSGLINVWGPLVGRAPADPSSPTFPLCSLQWLQGWDSSRNVEAWYRRKGLCFLHVRDDWCVAGQQMLALLCGTFPYKFIIQSLNKYLSSTGMVGNVLALRMQSWRRHSTYPHGAYISVKTDKQKPNIYVHDFVS